MGAAPAEGPAVAPWGRAPRCVAGTSGTACRRRHARRTPAAWHQGPSGTSQLCEPATDKGARGWQTRGQRTRSGRSVSLLRFTSRLLFPRSRDAALRRGRAGVPGPRPGAPRALQHRGGRRGSRRTAPLPPRAATGLSPPTPSFLATEVLAHSGHSRPLAPHLLDRPAKTTTPGKGRGRGPAPPASCRPSRGSRGSPPPSPTPPWLGRAGRRGGARARRAGLAPAPGAPGSAAESRLRLRDASGGRGDRRQDRRVSTGPGIGDEWGAAGEEGAARGPRE